MQKKYRPLMLLFPVMLVLTACVLPISIARIRKGDLSQYTTPLDSEVIDDICEKFELSGDRRCRPGQVVYAPDFFPVILASFERGMSTREDVRNKLGRYEYNCDKPIYVPSLDSTYYWCSYDLNGDKVFPIGIRYDVENNLDVVTGMVATIVDN